MRRLKILGLLTSWLITLSLVLLLICNVYIISLRFLKDIPQPAVLGWSWAVVVSGSMEPEIGVNDLILVHREKDYAVGDVISYESGGVIVTHRIVEKNEASYITQGDANNTPDFAPVNEEQIVGKVRLTIPEIGFFIEFLQTPLGMTCIVFAGLLLIETPYLLSTCRKDEERGRHEFFQ